MNQKHLEFLCAELQLDSPNAMATRVYGSRGGSFMWRVHTKNGSYAIKQLAPIIDLKNQKIVAKYELSEIIAYRFKQRGIPAISALDKSGTRLFIIENTGYLVYPWIDGYTLDRNEISEVHALKIAEILANLHSINMSVPEIAAPRFDIHTNDKIGEAIGKAVSYQCSFAKNLKENQNLILTANDSYLAAIPFLKEDTVVTHGDLDQLNVIWNKADEAILIDWESTRKMNPTREIVRTSLGWAGIGNENFSLPTYTRMLHSYNKSGGMLNINQINAALHSVFGSMINWLLYNIEISCTNNVLEEKEVAVKEINSVIMEIVRLKKLIPTLLKCIDKDGSP